MVPPRQGEDSFVRVVRFDCGHTQKLGVGRGRLEVYMANLCSAVLTNAVPQARALFHGCSVVKVEMFFG